MMKYLYLTLPLFFLFSCNPPKISPIEFDSKEYDFADNIQKVLDQSEETTFSATKFSFISEYEKVLFAMDKGRESSPSMSNEKWDSLNNIYNLKNADEFILEKAKDHEITMFNEAHHMPIHRKFLRDLLPGLHKIGYRYLAIETLGMLGDGYMFDKKLPERGYPLIHTGFYSKEPEFGLLIRDAIQLGFTIIGYDEGSTFGYPGGKREVRGAQNIVRQLEETKHLGKTIVYCGYSHLKEGESRNAWEYALAARLQEYTGHDPLTINQTSYMERTERSFENPLYQRITPDVSKVFLDKTDESIDLSKSPHWYDYFVFHPRTSFSNKIPSWILNNRKAKKFSLKEIDIQGPCKVLLFDTKDDVQKAPPIYVTEISSINDSFYLPLHSNTYKIVITNKESSYLIEYQ